MEQTARNRPNRILISIIAIVVFCSAVHYLSIAYRFLFGPPYLSNGTLQEVRVITSSDSWDWQGDGYAYRAYQIRQFDAKRWIKEQQQDGERWIRGPITDKYNLQVMKRVTHSSDYVDVADQFPWEKWVESRDYYFNFSETSEKDTFIQVLDSRGCRYYELVMIQ